MNAVLFVNATIGFSENLFLVNVDGHIYFNLDSSYADTLLNHAKEIYDFGVKYQGNYSDSITDAANYYK